MPVVKQFDIIFSDASRKDYNFPTIDSGGARKTSQFTSNSEIPLGEFWPNVEDLVYDSQEWFWTERWQKMETEAAEDLAEGHVETFQSMDEMIAFLDSNNG